MKRSYNRCGVIALTLVILSGCGEDNDNDNAKSSITGMLLDSPVEGVRYAAGNYSGTTDRNGQFQCKPGESVTFFLGNLELGSAGCQKIITPIELSGSSSVHDLPALNMARLLQSLDEDGNATNGLNIPALTASIPPGSTIDFSLGHTDFEAQPIVQTLLSDVAGMAELRDSCQAGLHLKRSLAEAGVLEPDSFLPVCPEVRAAVKVVDGLQQTASETEVAVTVRVRIMLDNFVLGEDGRAEVYIDGVYEALVDTPLIDLALVPGIHEIRLKLVDLTGSPVNVADNSAVIVDIQDGKTVDVALPEEMPYLKPYQLFQLYQSGINLPDGEQVIATVAGQELTLIAQNNVLQGVAPDVPAGSHLLELEIGGHQVSLQVDFLRNESADPKAEIKAIIEDMKYEIATLVSSLDPVDDSSAIQALTEISESLDVEKAAISAMTAEEAQVYHLFLDANLAGQSLASRQLAAARGLIVSRSAEQAYACAEFKRMARAALKLSFFAGLTAEFAVGTGGAAAVAGLPGFLIAGGATAVPLYLAINAVEEFKAAFNDSVSCYRAERDILQTVSARSARSSYRTKSTVDTINVQDGVQKTFTVKTTYVADDPQYADAVRTFSRSLSQLESLSAYLPESWMAAVTPPSDLTIENRESISEPGNYHISVTSGDDVKVTTTTSGDNLVLEFASAIEQDFTFDLINSVEGITTSYSAHITVITPIAEPGALEVMEGDTGYGDLTSSDPDATYMIASEPTNGAVSLSPSGEFAYMPYLYVTAPATDTFTFVAVSQRGVESKPATVNITVVPFVQCIDNPDLFFAGNWTYLSEFRDTGSVQSNAMTLYTVNPYQEPQVPYGSLYASTLQGYPLGRTVYYNDKPIPWGTWDYDCNDKSGSYGTFSLTYYHWVNSGALFNTVTHRFPVDSDSASSLVSDNGSSLYITYLQK